MISWVTTSSMAPAANARPKGSSSSATSTSQAHSKAKTGSTRPEAAPIRKALKRDIPAPARTSAITRPSGTSCKAMPIARLSAPGKPPPAATPMAMPSGMLWAMIAITNSQIRGAITGCSDLPLRLEPLDTLWSTTNKPMAPSRMPKLITAPAPQGVNPMALAASSPGTISENAVAASMMPAPNPSSPSDTATGIPLITSTGTAPSAVPRAAIEPPSNARINLGSRFNQAMPCMTSSAVPNNSRSEPNARRINRPLLIASISERIDSLRSCYEVSGQRSLVATGNFFPVDDVVKSVDVFRTTVLVEQVIGMLPDVQPQNRRIAIHEWAVLVATALDHQFFLGSYAQPRPTATETGQGSLGEGVLETLETTQLLIDCLGHGTLGQTAAIRRHDRPEQRVVGMTATLVDHRRAQFFRQRLDAGHQLLDWP